MNGGWASLPVITDPPRESFFSSGSYIVSERKLPYIIRRILWLIVGCVITGVMADFIYSRITLHRLKKWESRIERNAEGVRRGCAAFTMGPGGYGLAAGARLRGFTGVVSQDGAVPCRTRVCLSRHAPAGLCVAHAPLCADPFGTMTGGPGVRDGRVAESSSSCMDCGP